MKKLLYITPYYKPAWFYGGPPKYIAEQADYLAAHFDCSVDVVTLNRNGDEKLFDTDEVVVKEINKVTVHYLPPSGSKLGRAYFSSPVLKSYLEQFKAYDLVHIHMLFNAFSTVGAAFSIKHGIPFGYSLQGTLDRFSLTRSKWLKRAHRLLYDDGYLSKAAFVHFTTEDERKNALVSKDIKAVVIPLGTVLEPFVEYPKRGSDVDLRMVYLSRINRKKGLDLLVAALAELKGKVAVSLDIFGEDDDRFIDELNGIIASGQLQGEVAFKGKLDPSERNRVLQSYDVLALTSRQENFGLVVTEALDQKIPVLISDKVNVYDEVEKHQCGWVTSLSVSDIARKIEEAAHTPPPRRREMGERGHAFVRANYSYEKVGNAYWKLYESKFNH